MDVSQAVQSYLEYHRLNSKKNTLKNYDFVFNRFNELYGILVLPPTGSLCQTKRKEVIQLQRHFYWAAVGIKFK
jgi:hypothetical protein